MYIKLLQNIKLLKTYFEHQNSLWYIDSISVFVNKTIICKLVNGIIRLSPYEPFNFITWIIIIK